MTSDKRLLLRNRAVYLIHKLGTDTSEARKIRAYLKRAPLALTDAPDAWEFVYRGLDQVDVFSDKEYQAIYTAIRFYSLHRAANSGAYKAKSEGGKDIAEVLASYRKTKGGQNIDSKISTILATSDSLRLVRLLEPLFVRAVKEVKTPLDYGEFVIQLNAIQYPQNLRSVLLNWGKNYYKNTYEKTDNKETK